METGDTISRFEMYLDSFLKFNVLGLTLKYDHILSLERKGKWILHIIYYSNQFTDIFMRLSFESIYVHFACNEFQVTSMSTRFRARFCHFTKILSKLVHFD